MDKEKAFKEFGQAVAKALAGLDGLLNNEIVCKNDKILLKVARFKQYLLDVEPKTY